MDDIAWYGSGYMLPHTVLQPTLASFYKAFHPTYVYFVSVLIFECKSDYIRSIICIARLTRLVGSCLCAAAPTSTVFIIGRVIAGCGASGILQGTLNIISNAVPKKKVPLYYGYVLSVQGISACSAPIFGGIFSDKVSWRWCFWMCVRLLSDTKMC
jgi:MFS family permease